MKIKQNNKEITFTFPRYQKRMNPYGSDEANDRGDFGEHPTFTGLIIHHRKNGSNWDEIGFAETIDMDYKGKEDQTGGIIVAWQGTEEDFIKKCEELGLGYLVMEF